MFVKWEDYTRFEKARIIGARALQISMGAPVLIKVKKTETNPITLAKMEFENGVVPLTIKRTMPSDLEE
jgi:DNA-directed RNA polymerase subunit K